MARNYAKGRQREVSILSNHSQSAKIGYTIVVKFFDDFEKKFMDEKGNVHFEIYKDHIVFNKTGHHSFKCNVIGSGTQKGFRISNPRIAAELLNYTGNHKFEVEHQNYIIRKVDSNNKAESTDDLKPTSNPKDFSWVTEMAERNKKDLEKKYQAQINKLQEDLDFYKDYASEVDAKLASCNDNMKAAEQSRKEELKIAKQSQTDSLKNKSIDYLRQMIRDFEDMPKIQAVNDLIDNLFQS